MWGLKQSLRMKLWLGSCTVLCMLYFEFTRMPGESYWGDSDLCCCVFQALINSLVCWFSTCVLGPILFQNIENKWNKENTGHISSNGMTHERLTSHTISCRSPPSLYQTEKNVSASTLLSVHSNPSLYAPQRLPLGGRVPNNNKVKDLIHFYDLQLGCICSSASSVTAENEITGRPEKAEEQWQKYGNSWIAWKRQKQGDDREWRNSDKNTITAEKIQKTGKSQRVEEQWYGNSWKWNNREMTESGGTETKITAEKDKTGRWQSRGTVTKFTVSSPGSISLCLGEIPATRFSWPVLSCVAETSTSHSTSCTVIAVDLYTTANHPHHTQHLVHNRQPPTPHSTSCTQPPTTHTTLNILYTTANHPHHTQHLVHNRQPPTSHSTSCTQPPTTHITLNILYTTTNHPHHTQHLVHNRQPPTSHSTSCTVVAVDLYTTANHPHHTQHLVQS